MSSQNLLSPSDTLFLDIEGETHPMLVGACLVLDRAPLEDAAGRLDFDRIVNAIGVRVARQERYRQVVAQTPLESRPIWVPATDFDLDRHVRPVTLPMGSHEADLKDFCARFVRDPLDRGHPLWSIRIVEGFAARRFALVVKAHHCLADGITGIALLNDLLSSEPRSALHDDARAAGGRRRHAEVPSDGLLDRLSAELAHRRQATRRALEFARESFEDPLAGIERFREGAAGWRSVLATQSRRAAKTSLEAKNTRDRELEWIRTPMDAIHEIQSKQGGTLNDVVAATVALALSRHFEERDIGLDAQREMEFRLAIPVNMRVHQPTAELGNRISMLFAPVPVGESDPLVVLDRTRESLARAKHSGAAHALGSLLDLAEWSPRRLTRSLTRLALSGHPANLVLTNVPGPPRPLFLLESEILAIHPVVPLMPGQSLAVAVLSYGDHLEWGFHSDPGNFRAPAAWAEHVTIAFEDLHRAATHSLRHPSNETSRADHPLPTRRPSARSEEAKRSPNRTGAAAGSGPRKTKRLS